MQRNHAAPHWGSGFLGHLWRRGPPHHPSLMMEGESVPLRLGSPPLSVKVCLDGRRTPGLLFNNNLHAKYSALSAQKALGRRKMEIGLFL